MFYAQNHFRRYRGLRVPFSCFALPNAWALGPVFMFSAPGLVFCGTEGIKSCFHVLCSRTPFRQCRMRRVPFSYLARPDSFSTVPRTSSPVFLFCALRIIFGGTEGVGSHFLILGAQTPFRRYRERRVPFSCFALPDSISAEMRVSGRVFIFCPPELVFIVSVVRRASCPVFMYCAPGLFSVVPRASGPFIIICPPGLIFGGSEGVGSCFHVLRTRTRFRRYRGRRALFSCFALPYSFSTVPGASGPVFMFCARGHIFGGTKGVGSRIHVLRSRTHFRRYLGRLVRFSCFALPNSFSAVPRASGPVFMFFAPRLIFCGTEGIGSRFHVLCSRTRFRRYRGRRLPF
jgi:hypothetical protein